MKFGLFNFYKFSEERRKFQALLTEEAGKINAWLSEG